MNTRIPMLVAATLAFTACEGNVHVGDDYVPATEQTNVESKPTPKETPEVERDPITDPLPVEFSLSGDSAVQYMSQISHMLVSTPLSVEERARLQAEGDAAIRPILESWTTREGFALSIRDMMANKLKTSGTRNDIDFNLPGQLVEHVVQNDLPMSEMITADYCIDDAGVETTCDTGAPYTAGILTTRAFLAGSASRFNLGRAATMMLTFACRIYPMEEDLQPRAPKPELIEMFRAERQEEQTVEEAKDAFGNGDACYTCHGQFGLHAQLFVKYDDTGEYKDGATGIQDPNGELGRSAGGLMTSHFENLQAKGRERTQIFGQDVENMAEAAQVISESDVFVPCMVRNIIEHGFGLNASEAEKIRVDVLDRLGAQVSEQHPNPTFANLVVETFSDPQIIVSVVQPEVTP